MGGIVDSIFGDSRSDVPGNVRFIPFPEASNQIGTDRTFSSPRLSVEGGRFSGGQGFEGDLLSARDRFLRRSSGGVRRNLTGLRGDLDTLRDEFSGNQNAFINARVNPLRAQVAQQRGNLRQDLGRRGVVGSLGNRELSGFDFDAGRALGDAESLATADALAARQGLIKQQQGIDQETARLLSNELSASTGVNSEMFNREIQGLGLGVDSLMNLLSIASNLSTSSGSQAVHVGQLNDAAAARRREGIGNAIQGTMAFFSDRRLKTDIEHIGKMEDGLNVYSFKYIGSDEQRTGVMADEVKAFYPDAVAIHESGYAMVDYAKLPHWS